MRCIIIDDEPLAVDLLASYVKKIPFLSLAGQYYDPVNALSSIRGEDADLIFLDINMPDISGVELAGILPSGVDIIFTTAYREYAIESYEKGAADYLVKPITFERFLSCVTRISERSARRTQRPHSFFVKTGKKIVIVQLDKVERVEGLRDYVNLFYEGKKIIVSRRLKDFEASLPEFFQRIHLSHIINLNYIQKIEDNHVYLPGAKLSISDKYRQQFYDKVKPRML